MGHITKSPDRCYFAVDTRINRNGQVFWDPRQSFPRDHWVESIKVFGRIGVLARTQPTTEAYTDKVLFPSDVEIGELPYYVGPLAAVRKILPLIFAGRSWAARGDRFVLRMPAFVPIIFWLWLRLYRKPYALEVLGDPREVFEVVHHPLSVLWKNLYSGAQRLMIRKATAVLYISRTLADRYPARFGTYSVVVSDVRLGRDIYTKPRHYGQILNPIRLVHVGTMDQPYKGQDYLLRAIDLCRRKNLAVKATFIGDGRLRESLEALSRELKLEEAVQFCGSVSWGTALFRLLDQADLFIMCSLTEGLGKALLEAMARGLPAVGSNVGGIPELLPPEVLVEPSNAVALAAKIMELAGDPGRLTRLSLMNFQESLKYRDELLSEKRTEFYRRVRDAIG